LVAKLSYFGPSQFDLLFAGHLRMAVKVRGGVMSTEGSTNNVTAIETDMRDVLRARKTRLTDASRPADNDYSGLVSGISVRSIQEIDHLIDGFARAAPKAE
jgi:hypothetical protein